MKLLERVVKYHLRVLGLLVHSLVHPEHLDLARRTVLA